MTNPLTTTKTLEPCDYLIIGAGAASFAFIDTLLREEPSLKLVLVDKRAIPGGHWVDAYDYVRLHQPSVVYGVASKQLEGNWAKTFLLNGTLPWNHRATKEEILAYYRQVLDEWIAKGQVSYFPESKYDFSKLHEKWSNDINERMIHRFSSSDGKTTYSVEVKEKLVNGVLGECKIPSQCPLEFPVDTGVKVLTPNELFKKHKENSGKNSVLSSWYRKGSRTKSTKYVILGCGKTAMDAVVFLQSIMDVSPDNITWIIPNDVWILNRHGNGSPMSYAQAVLQCDGNNDKACKLMEDKGDFFRLDSTVQPTKFRFPTVAKNELEIMRRVKNVVRRGRATSIRLEGEVKDTVSVYFGEGTDKLSLRADDAIFVHCASPGPFNGNEIKDLFVSSDRLDLFLLFPPPVTISMSCIAKLESVRRKGTLNVEFGRKLFVQMMASDGNQATASDNDILKLLIQPLQTEPNARNTMGTLLSLAIFFSLVDENPIEGLKWMRSNRLSLLSIPGFRCEIYENMCDMVEKRKVLGLTESEEKMMVLVRDKLAVLAGQ